MPAMGESVTEGTILEWAKQPGDAVAEDETIVEISTDKVDAEVPAPASGTIDEILAQAGDTVTVGQVIARMTTGNGAAPAAKAPEPTSAPRAPGQRAGADARRRQGHAGRRPRRRRARRGPREGPGLRARPGASPRPTCWPPSNGAHAPRAAEAKLLKGASAMLARYMDESRSIPTATSFRTITVTDARRPPQAAQGGRPARLLHAPDRLRDRPRRPPSRCRSWRAPFQEIDGKPHVLDAGAVNLGIAVDVERKDGGRTLMVPVIRDAGRLSFPEFLDAFGDLITRARENTLTADDLQGANVSLTNPGGIGTIASVPRLMSGQGTIVATGAIGFPPGHGERRRAPRR